MKTRQDLIIKIQKRANRVLEAKDRLLRVVELLENKDWRGAIEAARAMETAHREEIPSWGWDMMREASLAIRILEVLG